MSDKLLKVIEDLQSDKSLDSLSEADISLGVVLRILDALSWSTYDRREVSSEYSVENRWVDYALLISNAPQVFIEVKKGGNRWKNTKNNFWITLLGRVLKLQYLPTVQRGGFICRFER